MSNEISLNSAQTKHAKEIDPANRPQSSSAENFAPWKPWQKIGFRIAFIFFILMSIPTSEGWYASLFQLNWLKLHYRDIYDIARFSNSFVRFSTPAYNLNGYADWVAALVIGTIGGLVWTAIDRKRRDYNALYYWLRVIVRYRAGIGIIGFGYTKLFPVQMPYPSWGLLNANFGDLTAQKIYWLSVGIVPWYQVFAGVVELTAGTLLFFRKTTTIGAILLFGALGDITYVNFAYDGGVHVYASYFVLYAAFLIADAVPDIYRLFILEKTTVPKHFIPSFSQKWLQITRYGLKSAAIFIFLILLFYLQYVNFKYDPYKQPSTSGVHVLRGNYRVSEFRINNRDIPYSPLDSVRWKNVTFEKWSTLTYEVNRPVLLDLSNGGGAPSRDINRTFELTGVAGGKRVFYYDADTLHHELYLQDKNVAASRRRGPRGRGADGEGGSARGRRQRRHADSSGVQATQIANSGARALSADSGSGNKNRGRRHRNHGNDSAWIPKDALAYIRDENTAIDEAAQSARRTREIAEEQKDKRKRNRMILSYSTQDGSHVILKGIDEHRDSIYVVLDRINKPYALSESSLQAGKY